MKYWVIWKDYDGTYLQDYVEDNKDLAENQITEILNREKIKLNGTVFLGCIYGNMVNYEVLSFIKKVHL